MLENNLKELEDLKTSLNKDNDLGANFHLIGIMYPVHNMNNAHNFLKTYSPSSIFHLYQKI